MKYTATIFNAQQGHGVMKGMWENAKALSIAGHRVYVTIKTETRSLAQNARMWAMLADVSAQIVWHGNKLSPEEWKTMFTASLKKQRVLPGLDGGFVVMGDSTSQMTIAEMGELMELMEAFAAERDVMFSAPEPDETPPRTRKHATGDAEDATYARSKPLPLSAPTEQEAA